MNTEKRTLKEIAPSLWTSQGSEHDITFIVSGGIHGNEKTGIHVVRQLKSAIEEGILRLKHGTLFLLLGNLKAIQRDERYTQSGVDLNRMFTGNISDEHYAIYEAVRAREIMDALCVERYARDSVIGIDIHSTNTPSKPFIVSQRIPGDLGHAVLPYLKTAELLLCDPDLVFEGELVCADEYYARRGLGLCYETGHADDLSRVEIIYNEIISLGMAFGVFEYKQATLPCVANMPPMFILRESILLTEDGFEYAGGFGDQNFLPFSKGACIGHHGKRAVYAPFDGVFVFPKIKKHWRVGTSLGYLTQTLY
jgi:succinylglutamate desuccinylase